MGSLTDKQKNQINSDLGGFTWFDTVQDILKWQPQNVDPIKISNTPLVQRPKVAALSGSNILIVPCYHNGYLPTGNEACQGAISDRQEYFLEYWQYTEGLIYFSHNRASIPPPTWINAGHRNGALVLGTFIIETGDGTPHPESTSIIESRDLLAKQLAAMAECYGFDGWLLNFECSIEPSIWDGGEPIKQFITKLRNNLRALPSKGKVVWYDALTTDNVKDWQRTLDQKNLMFAEAAGSFYVDYSWQLSATDDSVRLVAGTAMSTHDVYFGSDCWGQTGESSFGVDEDGKKGPKIGTGHGGTATGLTVKELKQRGLGTAIWASAWTSEHFKRGEDVGRFMWEGKPALDSNKPNGPQCDCSTGLQNHMRSDLAGNPIVKSAQRYPSGSKGFFHTDYVLPISRLDGQNNITANPDDEKYYKYHLDRQSIWPVPGQRTADLKAASNSNAIGVIGARPREAPSRCSIGVHITSGSNLTGNIELHKLKAQATLNLEASILYQRLPESSGLNIRLLVELGEHQPPKYQEQDLPTGATYKKLDLPNTEDITGIGIAVDGPAGGSLVNKGNVFLLDIYQITIKPRLSNYALNTISNIAVTTGGTGVSAHQRITWSIQQGQTAQNDLPWSPTTGPFSHFIVSADGEELGRAYALAFAIPQYVSAKWKTATNPKNSASVSVKGYAFDGTLLGQLTRTVQLA